MCFDERSAQSIAGRYNSRTAEIYRFMPAFHSRQLSPKLFQRCLEFLSVTGKFYRTRSSDDPFENTLPWYDTVNMIVGVRQGEDAEDQVTSILMFQAVIGEA